MVQDAWNKVHECISLQTDLLNKEIVEIVYKFLVTELLHGSWRKPLRNQAHHELRFSGFRSQAVDISDQIARMAVPSGKTLNPKL